MARKSMEDLDDCMLFTYGWSRDDEEGGHGREEAASVVVPGLPGCGAEDLSFCPQGNRELENVCSGMMPSVL